MSSIAASEARHLSDATALTQALGEEVRKMILDRAHEIRGGCLRADLSRSGVVSVPDFRKVLYFEAGLPYSAVSAVVAHACPPGPSQHTGFVSYDVWLHSFCDLVTGGNVVAAPRAAEHLGLGGHNAEQVMEGLRHVCAGNFDKLMRAFVMQDVQGSGQLSTPEFVNTLHMQLGVPGEHLQVLFHTAGIDSSSGFVAYSDWLRFTASSPVSSASDLVRFYIHSHAAPAVDPLAAQMEAERRAIHAGHPMEAHLHEAQRIAQADAQAHASIVLRETHVTEEHRVHQLHARLHHLDKHTRDVAFERHILDAQVAEEDRLLRLSTEKQEEHALLRNALREPPASARFTKELLAEKRARELTPAQNARLVDELLEIHVASPTRAMGFVQRLPLDPSAKLDLFRNLKSSVNTKEDRFVRDLRVLEYLNTANPEGTLGPKQEAELIDKIRRTTASCAKKVEVLKEMPIDAAKKLELLHEMRLYNVIDTSIASGRREGEIGNPLVN